MKLAALISGGKDGLYAAWRASRKHSLMCFATMVSRNPDSYMFHTQNIHLVEKISEACVMPLVTEKTKGKKEKELEDLKKLLKGLNIEGVSVGAIASNYQYQRVEKTCKSLGLKVYDPIWQTKPEKYLKKLLKKGFRVVITKVAAEGFDKSWLGRELDDKCIEDLKDLNQKNGVHLAGEGGEYETLVLDCPMYRRRLKMVKPKKKWSGKSGCLKIKKVKLVKK